MTISPDEMLSLQLTTTGGLSMAEGVQLGAAVMFVRNLDRSVAFYIEILGLSVVDRSPTAALLGVDGGPQLVLRAFGENASHPLGSVGVQYLVWMTESRADLDRRTELLRRRAAYTETHTRGDAVTVEGRDPDDLVLMLGYRPPGQPALQDLPARVYAW
ncbi:MAG: VOC family protein [Actinobacteria bacterium]|nr:VOC family protein [Actinomycetota bacterium]